MGWNGHDKTGTHVRVNEGCRKDRDFSAGVRVDCLLVDELSSHDSAKLGYFVLLHAKLLCCFLGDNPLLPVNFCFQVVGLRVCPEVGDTKDGLRAKGCARNLVLAELVHDKDEVHYFCAVAFEEVVVSNRLFTDRAVSDRVLAFLDFALTVNVGVLPFDELAVLRDDGGESASPVNGKTELLHDALVLVCEVVDDSNRISELL